MSLLELKQGFIWVFILLIMINFVVRGKYVIPINLFIDKKKIKRKELHKHTRSILLAQQKNKKKKKE